MNMGIVNLRGVCANKARRTTFRNMAAVSTLLAFLGVTTLSPGALDWGSSIRGRRQLYEYVDTEEDIAARAASEQEKHGARPTRPLDPERLQIVRNTPPKLLEYVDVTLAREGDGNNASRQHPHMGAADEHGNLGYSYDETFLRQNPPPFDFTSVEEKAEACKTRDSHHKMLTEKVFVDLEADRVANENARARPRILCVIFTVQSSHGKLEAISRTWGSKCDGIVYASDKTDPTIGTVNILHEGEENYHNIWQKNRAIWSYVYDNFYDKYDYFHSGGDDVYLLVENLRLYLESEEIQAASNGGEYLPNGGERYQTPLYLGRRFANYGNMDDIFNSGGSGYTLNKAALKTLVVEAMPTCEPHAITPEEDVLVARCLRKHGVLPYDTRDEAGGQRYMPTNVSDCTVTVK